MAPRLRPGHVAVVHFTFTPVFWTSVADVWVMVTVVVKVEDVPGLMGLFAVTSVKPESAPPGAVAWIVHWGVPEAFPTFVTLTPTVSSWRLFAKTLRMVALYLGDGAGRPLPDVLLLPPPTAPAITMMRMTTTTRPPQPSLALVSVVIFLAGAACTGGDGRTGCLGGFGGGGGR